MQSDGTSFCVYVVFTALTWYTVMKTVFKTKNMKIHSVQNNAKLTQPQTLENYASTCLVISTI